MVGSAAGSETLPLHYLFPYDCSTFSSYSVYSSAEAPSVLEKARPPGASRADALKFGMVSLESEGPVCRGSVTLPNPSVQAPYFGAQNTHIVRESDDFCTVTKLNEGNFA